MTTEIGWAHVPDGKGGRKIGRTLNHQAGCREVSPACRLCYAAKLAHRGMSPQHKGLTVMRTNAAGEPLGVHWNGKINRVPTMLAQPFKWRAPSGIFVGSMTDTFFDVSTDEACRWIAALFGVMAATQRHTYMLLTKRPENAAIFFAWLDRQCEGMEDERAPVLVCLSAALDVLTEKRDLDKINAAVHDDSIAWPLSNVWLGVTAEDQRRADERRQCAKRRELDRRGWSAPTMGMIVVKNCRALRRLRHHRARRRFCNRAPMAEQIGDLDFVLFSIRHRPWLRYG